MRPQNTIGKPYMLARASQIAEERAMPGHAQIKGIYRYPVKGLSPEPITSVALVPGETLPADRAYAIENGPSGFDSAAPAYFPKQRFLMLMKNERLATLATFFDDATHVLSVWHDGKQAAQGDLRTEAGRIAIEVFLARFCASDLRGPPRILHAPGHSFSDVARKVVSIINLASVAALAQVIGAPVDPLRFRANLYVEGWRPWQEFELLNQDLAAGPTIRLKVVKRIVRCAATNVDPRTGLRDLAIPETLMRNFAHGDCGVYAEVVAGGSLSVGDHIGAAATAHPAGAIVHPRS
jgi:uncharacterized protein YcbX